MTMPTHILRLADLPNRRATSFTLEPGDADCAALARALDVLALRRARLKGTIAPLGKHDWQLKADLGATVQQPCVVTLVPVTTRIEEQINRRYLSDWLDPDADESQMPDDTDSEALPAEIDLYAVLFEALTLAVPAFPRAEGAQLDDAQFAAPGITPMRDEDARPFAGLAALKAKLKDN